MRSVIELHGLALPVSGHSNLLRLRRTVAADLRAPGPTGPVDLVLGSTGFKFFGLGAWAVRKRRKHCRSWRMLHMGVDAFAHCAHKAKT